MFAPQGSTAWLLERCGHVTCSEFDKIMKTPKKGDFSVSAMTYMFKLIGEHYAGFPDDDFESFAMQRGSELEPKARDAYEWASGNVVTECGFVKHESLEWVGGSPDGLVGDDGLIEIKCPISYENHIRVIDSREVPDEYVAQCQGNLWITKRKWCDFVSYDPRMKKCKMEICIVRMERDPVYTSELSSKVTRFRDLMLSTMKRHGVTL